MDDSARGIATAALTLQSDLLRALVRKALLTRAEALDIVDSSLLNAASHPDADRHPAGGAQEMHHTLFRVVQELFGFKGKRHGGIPYQPMLAIVLDTWPARLGTETSPARICSTSSGAPRSKAREREKQAGSGRSSQSKPTILMPN